MITDIHIKQWASVSPLGSSHEEIWENYLKKQHFLSLDGEWKGPVSAKTEHDLELQRSQHYKYRHLDKITILALMASQQLKDLPADCGLSIGSSRGATSQFEAFYDDFLNHGHASPLASPTTTLGNVSSWVAQDLGLRGFEMSHSVTCSTALHGVANACAWIAAGFSKHFIAGGSEAPLTPFTIAQMKAMRIYAEPRDRDFPCRSYDLEKQHSSMILGEGAGLFHLSRENGSNNQPMLRSIGFATEPILHGSSISDDGQSLREAMEMALQGIDKTEIDAIVMHAPGTIKGDLAEKTAIEAVFGEKTPLLTSNKWKIGHTLGASGALSMEFALLMLQHQTFIALPWNEDFIVKRSLKNIMVNAVGFGGNAVSVVIGQK